MHANYFDFKNSLMKFLASFRASSGTSAHSPGFPLTFFKTPSLLPRNMPSLIIPLRFLGGKRATATESSFLIKLLLAKPCLSGRGYARGDVWVVRFK